MRGGYRQGAGRKQGFAAKHAEEARRILSEMVIGEIKPIGKALIAKAKKGDVAAVRELFDRAFGKAPQNAKINLLDERRPQPILDLDDIRKESTEGDDVPPIYGGLSTKSVEV